MYSGERMTGRIRVFAIAIMLLACTGCGLFDGSGYNAKGKKVSIGTGYEEFYVDTKEANDGSSVDFAAERTAAGLTDEVITSLMEQQKGRYCYDTMDPTYHKLYVELLYIVDHHGEDIPISTNSQKELAYAFQCMYNDHPEIFWIDGFVYTKHMSGKKVAHLSFGGRYTYTESECKQYQAKVDTVVHDCVNRVAKNSTDYDKVKYVYEYLINNTDYVIGSQDNQNILSVFLYGESVCQGYAKAAQYLLNEMGVQCTMVAGVVSTGEGHAWNLVKADGRYYHMDATWGDINYNDSSGIGTASAVNYDYMLVTTDEIEKSRTIDNVIPLPQCIATEDNYYVKEERLFSKYEKIRVEWAFDNAYKHGEATVSLKCTDEAVYDDMYEHLINKQEVFDILENPGDEILYVGSREQLVLTFWL